MIRFLAFCFGRWIYKPYSFLIVMILRLRGITVGKGFYCEGVPYLKIRGQASNITIGNNVRFGENTDLRNRENGKIIIGDNTLVDSYVRLVSANDAILKLENGAEIGAYTIVNAGTDIIFGEKVMVGAFCYVQSADHGFKKGIAIKDQPYTYGEINIGKGAWLAGSVSVTAGVTIGDGTVVGARSVVTKDTDSDGIYVGIPAKKISDRPAD